MLPLIILLLSNATAVANMTMIHYCLGNSTCAYKLKLSSKNVRQKHHNSANKFEKRSKNFPTGRLSNNE